jgi:hypothetical protein
MTPKTGVLHSLGVNIYLGDDYIHLHGPPRQHDGRAVTPTFPRLHADDIMRAGATLRAMIGEK